MPELRLPTIRPDDVLRSLSEIRMPDVDLPNAVANVEWPKIEPSSVDVGKAIAGLARAGHIGGRARRPRWRLAAGGLIFAGLVGWTIYRNESLRTRVASRVEVIRQRIAVVRSSRSHGLRIDGDDPIAFPAAETASIKATQFADRPTDVTHYPAGLGANNGDGIPAFEETGSPV